eukprot:CAMPEP_0176466098 /NCGR_PEP_ID=MMETSP0127-20121128/37686_1 /TAXON_ID=938130 /ORGANISM="Platyophrya macrostoma, Strain WH" /LENGTH=409 /DNA_ID=CAMNT_0017859193 /DNA_START=31 /DNA_END=1260 /DNA_ORIENTATION=-
MAFALIFLIVLSIILIVGAILIWKSDLPNNDKIVSIIAILALFALVSIVNEAKKTSVGDTKYNIAEFQKGFFTPNPQGFENKYHLPVHTDFRDFIASTLGEYSLESSKSVAFLLLEGDALIGKTQAFREYVKMLQTEKVPALYLDMRNVGSTVHQLTNYLKLSSLGVLDEAVEKFNKNDKIPTLVLDHFEYIFSENDHAATSALCSYLRELFDAKKVNIIMVTNNWDVKLKLRTDEGISRRLTVREIKKKSLELERYLIETFNPVVIKDSAEKKFTPENIQFLLNNVGFSWEVLHSYKEKLNKVQNVQEFCKGYIAELSQKIQTRNEEKSIYKTLLDAVWNAEAKKYINRDVAYSILKRNLADEDVIAKIKGASKHGYLKVGHGTITFASDAVMNAVIKIEKPNYHEEL